MREVGKHDAVLADLARELAGLFLFGEQLILHSAHEFKTAAEAFRRVLALVEGSDDLRRHVKKVRTSHGDEGIELMTGQRLRFVARSTGSGRGFSGDCVILDEAYKLPREALGALLPTLSARPNPQLWYTSSAGHRDSEVLRGVRVLGALLAVLLEALGALCCARCRRRCWARARPSRRRQRRRQRSIRHRHGGLDRFFDLLRHAGLAGQGQHQGRCPGGRNCPAAQQQSERRTAQQSALAPGA